MKALWKDIIGPVVVLTLICLLVTAALSATHVATREMIAGRAEADAAARRASLLDAATFEYVAVADDPAAEYYRGLDASGQFAGCVITTESTGYGGKVRVMTGIDRGGKIAGVTIVSHSETPGLGAKAAEGAFTERFQREIPAAGFKVIKGAASGEDEIAAITGATITSKAVTQAVNRAAELYSRIEGRIAGDGEE